MEVGVEEPVWLRTIKVKERLAGNPLFEEPDAKAPHGRYAGRTIIGRDTPINKGVYLGSGQREALVIDDERYPEELDSIYQEILNQRQKEIKDKQESFKSGILSTVFGIVKKKLKSDEQGVEDLVYRLTGSKNGKDRKIALNSFVNTGAGVCRHQALLAAYLLERLKRDDYISGQVSIDRNSIPGKGGHAWVRYQNSRGEIYIIDPAQNYIGALKDAPSQAWQYKRPGEY